jgi:hypothetical protein
MSIFTLLGGWKEGDFQILDFDVIFNFFLPSLFLWPLNNI